MSVYICLCVCVCVCVKVRCVCVSLCLCVCVYICEYCACLCAYISVCVCVCLCLYVCIYLCMLCVCLCVCMRLCVCISVCIVCEVCGWLKHHSSARVSSLISTEVLCLFGLVYVKPSGRRRRRGGVCRAVLGALLPCYVKRRVGAATQTGNRNTASLRYTNSRLCRARPPPPPPASQPMANYF